MSKSSSNTTTDHKQIREWVEKRGGQPATVKSTHSKDDAGLLRIDFPGYGGEDRLEPISWEEWFEKFEDEQLAFLYQEETSGGDQSNFNKLIRRQQ